MPQITPELREFIAAKFGSTDQLDVFALLYRRRERDWSPNEVGRELDVAAAAAGMRLFLLSSAGLLVSNGQQDVRYRYEPKAIIDDFAPALLQSYDDDRATIYAIINGSDPNDQVKQLADAFRLRK